jgi:hypothetical protein
MADEPHTPSTQTHPPTQPDPEPREETIARVVEESGQAQEITAHEESQDPTTRRGANRTIIRTGLAWAAVGAVVGAIAGLILSIAPGPFETDDVGDAIAYTFGLAAALFVVVGVVATLILLAREDGRVEREVERKTGRRPDDALAGPIDPEHDIKGR